MFAVKIDEGCYVTASHWAEQVTIGYSFPMVCDGYLWQISNVPPGLSSANAVVGIFGSVEYFFIEQSYFLYHTATDELACTYDIGGFKRLTQ